MPPVMPKMMRFTGTMRFAWVCSIMARILTRNALIRACEGMMALNNATPGCVFSRKTRIIPQDLAGGRHELQKTHHHRAGKAWRQALHTRAAHHGLRCAGLSCGGHGAC